MSVRMPEVLAKKDTSTIFYNTSNKSTSIHECNTAYIVACIHAYNAGYICFVIFDAQFATLYTYFSCLPVCYGGYILRFSFLFTGYIIAIMAVLIPI
jgi:hypothetical protein